MLRTFHSSQCSDISREVLLGSICNWITHSVAARDKFLKVQFQSYTFFIIDIEPDVIRANYLRFEDETRDARLDSISISNERAKNLFTQIDTWKYSLAKIKSMKYLVFIFRIIFHSGSDRPEVSVSFPHIILNSRRHSKNLNNVLKIFLVQIKINSNGTRFRLEQCRSNGVPRHTRKSFFLSLRVLRHEKFARHWFGDITS